MVQRGGAAGGRRVSLPRNKLLLFRRSHFFLIRFSTLKTQTVDVVRSVRRLRQVKAAAALFPGAIGRERSVREVGTKLD